jgi:hypothetical protein
MSNNQLSLRFRNDDANQWASAESQNSGKLAKGELGISLVKNTDGIVEVIGRMGVSDSPAAFSSCPVVFRSPFEFTQETSQIVKINETPTVNSFITYQFDTDGVGSFQTKSYDDVICDFQTPENVIEFDVSNSPPSGFLRWDQNTESPEGGEWVLDSSTVVVEIPDEIFGGTPESF